MSELFLGLDLGTSGLKAAVVHVDGQVVAEVEAGYTVESPEPGFAQIDPAAWEAAVEQALAQLPGLEFAAVGIAGQMHGVVLMDASGAAVRPAILWPDRRAEPQLQLWRALSEGQRGRLANPLIAGMAGPILAWWDEHDPGALREAAVAVQPKDYVRSRLGGPPVSERSDACATLLWDVPADAWAGDVVAAVGVPERLLPQIVPSDQVVATAALPGDPVLVAGAGDTPAALLGLGGLVDGQVQVNVGSGVQVLMRADAQPVTDPVTRLYADAAGGWYAMCAIQDGGLALDRVRRRLGLRWDEFFARAAAATSRAGELPVVTSADPTSVDDLALAAVEAMVFSVRRGLELLGRPYDSVQMSGGGARVPLVGQMLAAALGVPVSVVPDRSTSALGAAMLAAAGLDHRIPVRPGGAVTHNPVVTPGLEDAYRLWVRRAEAL